MGARGPALSSQRPILTAKKAGKSEMQASIAPVSKGPAPRESASSVAVKRMPVAQEWSESGMRRTFRSGSQRWEKGRWAFGKAGKNLSRVGKRFF